jgi:hypothetical protein
MISFIDEHRGVFGVEPICRLLPIAPCTYHENVAKRLDMDRLSIRARSDIGLKIEIRRVFEQNFRVYGVRKVWRQLKREGFNVARCTIARLMRSMSLQGIIRGKPIRTTFSDKTAPCPLDRLTDSSKPLHRTGCGFRISPMSPPGRVSSTWPLSLTYLLVASLVGGQAGRHTQASSSTPLSRPFTIDGPLMAAPRASLGQGCSIRVHSLF